MFSKDSNSGIQCHFSCIMYRAKDVPTTKAQCIANLEYNDEAQTFKHLELDLEALNDKVLGSVIITGVQIHRAAI